MATDDVIQRILNPGGVSAARAASRQQAPYVTEEEERSLVGNLRDKTLTTLGVLGNTLDLPGSMVRDVIAFRNPLDQLLTPFSSDNRTTGKELLENSNIFGPEPSWGKSIAGFGLEVAADPLTWMTFGGSALGKAGQAAKKAGLLDEAQRVTRLKTGAAPGTVGPRQARLTTSVQDIAKYSTGDTRRRAQDLLDRLTPEEAAAPLGGMVGFGLPFAAPRMVAGTGARAQTVAKGMDAAGRAIRFGKIPGTDIQNPLGAILGAFDAPAGGAKTAAVAEANRELFNKLPESAATIRAATANQATYLEDLVKNPNNPSAPAVDAYLAKRRPVWTGNAAAPATEEGKYMDLSDAIREGVEGVVNLDDMPQELRWIVDQMRSELDKIPGQMRRAGGRTYELADQNLYAARYKSQGPRAASPRDIEASTFDPSQGFRRQDFLRDIDGGTVAFRRKIVMDKGLQDLLDDKTKTVDDIADYLRTKHSGWLADDYTSFYRTGKNKGKPFVKKGRYQKMARMLYGTEPEVLKRGFFGNSILSDHMARMMSNVKATSTLKNMTDLLSSKDAAGMGRYIKGEGSWRSSGVNVGGPDDSTMRLSKFLKMMDLPEFAIHKELKTGALRKGGILRVLSKNMGISTKDLRKARIDKRIADDLYRVHKAATTRGPMDEILEMTDSATNMMKTFSTTIRPGFHVRNLASGWTQNAMLGMWDKQSAGWSMDLLQGRTMADSRKIEWVGRDYARRAMQAGWGDQDIEAKLAKAGYDASTARRIIKSAGRRGGRTTASQMTDPYFPSPNTGNLADLDDAFATRVIGQRAYADGVIGSVDADKAADVAGTPELFSGTTSEILGSIPRVGNKSMSPTRVAKKAFGMEEGTNLNPLNTRGVGGRMSSTFGPVAAGEEVGAFVDGLTRIQPYIALIRKGYEPEVAAKKVVAAQVAYSNRNFTPFELKYMRRLLPFYKFSRSQIPFQMKQLMERPGGPQAQLFRALNQAQSQGELAPDYVRDTASIPVSEQNPILQALIGAPPEGTDRYISGLGLMAEDLLSVGPGVRGTGQEFLSRLNPLIKGPLEYTTNQSFFQAGPEGGRPLDELDPLMGRILANVTGQKDAVQLPQLLEVAAANSPIASLLTTARTLTDPRKAGDYGALSEASPVPLPGVPALLNTLTGLRVTDVSPGSKDAIVRDLLESRMKGAGAKAFERVYFSKEQLAQMSPEDRQVALELQGLANVLARRTKERAAERKKNEANK
jgi:hypothetical protein